MAGGKGEDAHAIPITPASVGAKETACENKLCGKGMDYERKSNGKQTG